MILSRYPFRRGLVIPPSFQREKTSALLGEGLVVHMAYPGLPVYTPIGAHILARIEKAFERRFMAAGFQQVRLPHLVRSADLIGGEPIGPQFEAKFMHLKETMGDYHLMSTPEMLFVRMFLHTSLSHADLPIRTFYSADFFRQVSDLRPILRGRQFRIFGALSLELDEVGVRDTIRIVRQLTFDELKDRGIPNLFVESPNSPDFEVFYPTREGDDYAEMGNHDSSDGGSKRVRALSLGMAYFFGRGIRLPIRYRTPFNKNKGPLVSTYGLCTNRVLFAAFDHARDDQGFHLPACLRPFDVSVVPRTAAQLETAFALEAALRQSGLLTVLDDRLKFTRDERGSFASYLGTPLVAYVEREGIELAERCGGKRMLYGNTNDVLPRVCEHSKVCCHPRLDDS